jgi:hypothetical protein
MTPVIVRLPAGSVGLSLVTELRSQHRCAPVVSVVWTHAAQSVLSLHEAQQSSQVRTGNGEPCAVPPS